MGRRRRLISLVRWIVVCSVWEMTIQRQFADGESQVIKA